MNEYILNKIINPDQDFFGFKMRTRKRFYDEKIINQVLDINKNVYHLPLNPKVVIDIGGNIGCFSILAASLGANVLSFEPFSQNFEVLKYNVEINGFKDKVNCINLGVGKPGRTKLYIHPRNSGAVSSYPNINGLTEESDFELVRFISIHEVFSNYNIEHCSLLKLDCENSEKDIIRDFDDELANKTLQISVEFHDKKIIKELIDKLSKWYTPEHLRRYEWTFYRK